MFRYLKTHVYMLDKTNLIIRTSKNTPRFISPRSKYWLCLQGESVTDEMYEYAVSMNGYALQYVPSHKQTEDVCALAIIQNPFAIKYVHNQTQYLCALSLGLNPGTIKYIRGNK